MNNCKTNQSSLIEYILLYIMNISKSNHKGKIEKNTILKHQYFRLCINYILFLAIKTILKTIYEFGQI